MIQWIISYGLVSSVSYALIRRYLSDVSWCCLDLMILLCLINKIRILNWSAWLFNLFYYFSIQNISGLPHIRTFV